METEKTGFSLDIDTENKFLVDWFSFTTRIYDLNYLFAFLGLHDAVSSFEHLKGVGFYRERFYFGGINIHYASDNPSNVGTIWVEMSGHGCRTFETYSRISFPELFRKVLDDTDNYNVTRLDVAYDDFKRLIPLKKLAKQILAENFVSKFNSKSVKLELHPKFNGISCYIGSPSSDIRFRVYDKAAERGYDDEIEKGFTWTRWEMQLRDSAAVNYMSSVVKDGQSVGGTFKGVLLNYFRAVDVSKNDSNKRRWKMSRWYCKFIGEAEKISLFTPCDAEYNLSKCEKYVYKTAGNAVYTLIEIKGAEKFIEELKAEKSAIKPKYQDLINSYRDSRIKKQFSGVQPDNTVPSVPDTVSAPYVWTDIHDIEICEECGTVVSATDDDNNIYRFHEKLLCLHCYQNAFHEFMLARQRDELLQESKYTSVNPEDFKK